LEKHSLSKSTFLRGLQCAKSLYLYKNFIQLRDTPSAEKMAIFSRGNNVGVLAQELFPGGTDATPPKRSDNMAAIERTKALIESGVEIIYEAAFQHEQVLAILDVLVNIYEKQNGAKPNVVACHVGLECGILGTNYPGMDMISFGPTIHGAHSPDERASIKSSQKFWKFLIEILENIPVK